MASRVTKRKVVNWIISFAIVFLYLVAGPLPYESWNESRLKFLVELNPDLAKFHDLHENFTFPSEAFLRFYENYVPKRNEPEFTNAFNDNRPGLKARKQGFKMKHPVVIFPGFTSSALELWDGTECAKGFFRKRFWNTFDIVSYFINQKECWLQHMALDPKTGHDPENVRVRAVDGLNSVDYWATEGYFVWAAVIRNLADIGANPVDIQLANFDWRLHPAIMEERDASLSYAAAKIETLYKKSGQKVVVVAHSYGAIVFKYFMNWVVSEKGGNRGKDWCDKYVHAFANVAGPTAGVPKSITALLSGEFRDTAQVESQFGQLAVQASQMLLSTEHRVQLFRTWTSLIAMLPTGGDLLWGGWDRKNPKSHDGVAYNVSDDIMNPAFMFLHDSGYELPSSEAKLKAIATEVGCGPGTAKNCTMSQSIDLLLASAGDDFKELATSLVSFGNNLTKLTEDEPKTWTNSIESPLPYAPNMKILCMYGVNEYHSERGYWLTGSKVPDFFSIDHTKNLVIDDSASIVGGVFTGQGDLTVPLISEGTICQGPWKHKRFNPSQMDVRVVEYDSNPLGVFQSGDIQGGGQSGGHVDILGNVQFLDDLISLVVGEESRPIPNENIISETESIAKQLMETIEALYPLDGSKSNTSSNKSKSGGAEECKSSKENESNRKDEL